MEKKSLASLNTSSWDSVKGGLVKYANPVVAKTSCSWLLKALSFDSGGEEDERTSRSTIGSEEKEGVILLERYKE